MLKLLLADGIERHALNVLCIGAHCDDIDLGCGGTLLALLARRRPANVTWVTFSGSVERQRELRASARRFLRNARAVSVVTHEFRDGFFPADQARIKERFEAMKRLANPDVIFTHQRAEFHQDHRLLAELTWNTFRDHLILEYEIPKYEGGLTTPNLYVALGKAQVERKVRILMDSYRSQRRKSWFTADTLRAMMRLRGIESGGATGWAEGFHASKVLVG